MGLRLQNLEDVPAIHLMRPEAASKAANTPTLSDALELYLKLKGAGKDKVFVRTATRNVEYVVKVLGNRSIEQYSSADGAFGGWMTTGVGQRYGTGQPLEVKAKWMKRLVPL